MTRALKLRGKEPRSYLMVSWLTFVAILLGCVPAFAQSGIITSTSETWTPTNVPASLTTVYSPNGYNIDLMPGGGSCTTGDVDGNGSADIVCVSEPYGDTYTAPSSFFIFESTKKIASGLAPAQVVQRLPASQEQPYYTACAVADFDGDGRSDIACFNTTSSGYDQYYPSYPTIWFSTNGSPFSTYIKPSNWPLPLPAPPASPPNTYYYGDSPFGSYCTVGHFMSGPGAQILCNIPSLGTEANNEYYVYRFTASWSGGTETVTESQYTWQGPSHLTNLKLYGKSLGGDAAFGYDCLTGDFNGDGLTDLACPDGQGNWSVALSTGTGFSLSTWPTGQPYLRDCTTGDFNGDGKTDIICYNDGATNPLDIYLSAGSGFQVMQNWAFSGLPPPQDHDGSSPRDSSVFATVCSAADLNGDGKTDLLCYSNNAGSPGNWSYGISTGSSFQVNTLASIIPPTVMSPDQNPVSTAAEPFAGACILDDFMGTGLVDILCNPTTSENGNKITSVQPYTVAVLSRQ